MKRITLFLLLAPSVATQAQFSFTTNHGAITITGYTGSQGSVVIPSMINGWPVTGIGNSAFYNLADVTNVVIPDGVGNIDIQAFVGTGLTSIAIPDSVTNIGQSAFLDCSSLTSVTLGQSLASIGDYAFGGCPNLTNIFLPKSITNLVATAFNECPGLTNITADAENPAYSSLAGVLFDKNLTKLVNYPGGRAGNYAIPPGVTSIGDFVCAFSPKLTGVTFPDGITNIGKYAFSNCILTNLVLPANLIDIEANAFGGCANLKSVIIPDGVTTIGAGAFSGNNATNVIIPAGVTNLGPAAFSGYRLVAIDVAAGNPAYSSAGGVLFDLGGTTLVEFPAGRSGTVFKPGSYVIPNGVTSIGDGAFEGCNLGSATLPGGVTNIGDFAFSECSFLTNLTIPDRVTYIGNEAFSVTAVTNLTIPASVTTLGSLGECPDLRGIYFLGDAPAPVAGIQFASFIENITAYYLPGTTGWGAYFQSTYPEVLWLPQAGNGGGSPDVRTNQFGFNIDWAAGRTVVVDACTNLSAPDWLPVQTNVLAGGSAYFSDPQWVNYSNRFYRLRPL